MGPTLFVCRVLYESSPMRKKTTKTIFPIVKKCSYPGCPITFRAERSTRKYCGGKHRKAMQRKENKSRILQHGACHECGNCFALVVRGNRPICQDCLQFNKDVRRHEKRFPFGSLREPFRKLRKLPKSVWIRFASANASALPVFNDYQLDDIGSALLMCSPLPVRRACPVIELEGRSYRPTQPFEDVEWRAKGADELAMDPFEVLYGDLDAAA